MSVAFQQKFDAFGNYYSEARIESPYGGVFTVNQFTPLECSVSNQIKGGKRGFGVKFKTGKNCRVLQVGTVGEAENFIRNIKTNLSAHWFWKQGEDETY